MTHQQRVSNWVTRTFGAHVLADKEERALRVLEEAIELAQALSVDQARAEKLLQHVYTRPVGEVSQEIAGTGVTLLAIAASLGIDAYAAIETEIVRIESKDPAHFQRRNAEKFAAGVGNCKGTELVKTVN